MASGRQAVFWNTSRLTNCTEGQIRNCRTLRTKAFSSPLSDAELLSWFKQPPSRNASNQSRLLSGFSRPVISGQTPESLQKYSPNSPLTSYYNPPGSRKRRRKFDKRDKTPSAKSALSRPPLDVAASQDRLPRERSSAPAFYQAALRRVLRSQIVNNSTPRFDHASYQRNLRSQVVKDATTRYVPTTPLPDEAFRLVRFTPNPSRRIPPVADWTPSKEPSRSSIKIVPSFRHSPVSPSSKISQDGDWTQANTPSHADIKFRPITPPPITTPSEDTAAFALNEPSLPDHIVEALATTLARLQVYPYRPGTPDEAHLYLQSRDKHYLRLTEDAMTTYIHRLRHLRRQLHPLLDPIRVLPSEPQLVYHIGQDKILRNPLQNLMPEIENVVQKVKHAREYVRDLLVVPYEGYGVVAEKWREGVRRAGTAEARGILEQLKREEAGIKARLMETTDKLLRN